MRKREKGRKVKEGRQGWASGGQHGKEIKLGNEKGEEQKGRGESQRREEIESGSW